MPARLRLPLALVLDALVVLVFVAIGRDEHDEGGAIGQIVTTALPFWFGLVAGWIAAKVWRRPMAIATGLLIWPAVIVVGMLTRRWVFGEGTALAFVIVATLFLGVCLLGWRALARLAAGSAPAEGDTAAAGGQS